MRGILTTFLLFGSCVCFAQGETSAPARRATWVSVGGGLGTLTSSGGFCGRLSLSHQHGRHVYTLRAFRITEFIGDMVEPRSPRPEESETELAILYGRDISSGGEYFACSIGIGYINSRHRGGLLNQPPFGLMHELSSVGSIGIAFDVQVFFPLLRFFGVGLSFVGNLNTTRSFGGGLLSIQAGFFE